MDKPNTVPSSVSKKANQSKGWDAKPLGLNRRRRGARESQSPGESAKIVPVNPVSGRTARLPNPSPLASARCRAGPHIAGYAPARGSKTGDGCGSLAVRFCVSAGHGSRARRARLPGRMVVGDTHETMIIVFEYGLLAPPAGSRGQGERPSPVSRPEDRDGRPANPQPSVRRSARSSR
jgi:hypothetical protein